ncbi:MAG: hypothetical protein IPP10_15790 [Candidatus Competibacteraceae bacterium]|nr:hypothetical protein [Candidatus Competibacteraceae bacterium]
MSTIPNPSEPVTRSADQSSDSDPTKLLADLRERFPVLADFRPPKIRIHLDVRAALEGSGPSIRIARAMHCHANHGLYLKALAKGGPRYNLAGEVDGEVTEEQRRHAIQQLKERQRARKKKPKPPAPPDTPAAPPEPEPSPAQADDAPPARPILKLKPKAGPVVASAVVSRKGTQS